MDRDKRFATIGKAVASRYRLVLLGCVLLGLLVGFLAWQSSRKSPLVQLADNTGALLQTTNDLQSSFSADLQQDPAKIAKTYLDYMQQLQATCRSIVNYKTATPTPPAQVASTLNNTTQLCQDLTELANNSQKFYKSLLPLLQIHTPLKRYQTLPIMRSLTYSSHKNALNSVASRANTLRRVGDFPSAAPTLLKQLQQAMTTNDNFSYLTTVKSFQTKVLAERQQYWSVYSDLGSLQRVIGAQLTQYCDALDSNARQVQTCNQLSE